MKKFLAVLDIGLAVFWMALIGIKRANDFAFDWDLYPVFFWGTLVLIGIITYILLPKRSR